MPMLLIIGVSLFFLGVGGLMALLFAHGGAAKSRQLGVLAQLWSGQAGGSARKLVRGALLLTIAGALTCFAAVTQSDRERAERCRAHCLAAGYIEGIIGPSVERSKPGRFVACVCTAPDRARLELRADVLAQ